MSQIEKYILPAKVFSSMETAAGGIVEAVALPAYGWQPVPSTMHSAESVLDGKRVTPGHVLHAATIKSGPRSLNDAMAKDIASDVINYAHEWADQAGVLDIEFTYGVLYGTRRQSNKKDWHVLRNMGEAIRPPSTIISPCAGKWDMTWRQQELTIKSAVRIGMEWWEYLGGRGAWLEVCVAMIRACVTPDSQPQTPPRYTISDMAAIMSLEGMPEGYNTGILQRSQLEWLMLLARHFCDEIR